MPELTIWMEDKNSTVRWAVEMPTLHECLEAALTYMEFISESSLDESPIPVNLHSASKAAMEANRVQLKSAVEYGDVDDDGLGGVREPRRPRR